MRQLLEIGLFDFSINLDMSQNSSTFRLLPKIGLSNTLHMNVAIRRESFSTLKLSSALKMTTFAIIAKRWCTRRPSIPTFNSSMHSPCLKVPTEGLHNNSVRLWFAKNRQLRFCMWVFFAPRWWYFAWRTSTESQNQLKLLPFARYKQYLKINSCQTYPRNGGLLPALAF